MWEGGGHCTIETRSKKGDGTVCALLTSLGPRLVQDAIAAETAADWVARSNLILCSAITANVLRCRAAKHISCCTLTVLVVANALAVHLHDTPTVVLVTQLHH